MANILMLTLVFAPDCVSTANLMTEIATDLKALGHGVVVITTEPHSNIDLENREKQPLKPRWGKWLQESEINGVHVYHTMMREKGTKVLGRAWDYMLFHIISLVVALRMKEKWDIIFTPSPPLSIGVVAWLLSVLRRTPYIYNVQEIHPDALVEAGVLRRPFVISLMKKLESFVYAKAIKIVVISTLFKQELINKGVPPEKIEVVPNFVDVDDIKPLDKKNIFSTKHSLESKFVVLYAGNLGLSQDNFTLLEAAELLGGDPEIVFLVIGDGVERIKMEESIKEKNLTNVIMLPFQPRSLVPFNYATADVCLVGLRKRMAYTHVPSKIYTIMASGKPALVCAEDDSEIARIVSETGGGIIIPPEDPASLANAVLKLKNNKSYADKLGMRGRSYIVEHYSRGAVIKKHEKIIETTVITGTC